MSFQLVQTINRDGNVSLDEFDVKNKLFITPNALLGIRSNANSRIDVDMNVVMKLFKIAENLDSFSGVYFPLESWRAIRTKMNVEQQMFLMGANFNEKILLLPTVEALYYGLDKKMEKQLKLLIPNYPSIPDYYRGYRNFLGRNKSSAMAYCNWLPNINRNLRNYVFDFLRFQHNENVFFLIPPTPPIFDLERDLDYAERTFQIAQDFLAATFDDQESDEIDPLCIFIPISIRSFKTTEATRKGTEKLKMILSNLNPDIVLVKIFDETLKKDQVKENLKGLEFFCRKIIEYCKRNKKMSGIIDTKEYGHILLYKGLNFVGIPVNRHSESISLGGSKSGPPPRNQWKVLDPETRDEIPFSNYQNKVRQIRNRGGFMGNRAPLPYLTGLRRIYNRDNIQNLSLTAQNEFAKLTPLITASKDITELKNAIIEGNVRNIIARFSRNPSNHATKVRILLNEE